MITGAIIFLFSDTASWLPAPQSPSSPTPTVSVRVLPSLSTLDMKTTGQLGLYVQYTAATVMCRFSRFIQQ